MIEPDDVPPAEEVLSWPMGRVMVRGLAVDAHFGVFAVGDANGAVRVIGMGDGLCLAQFFTGGFVWDLAFSADHGYLTAIGVGGQVHRWDWLAEWDWGNELAISDGVTVGEQVQNCRPTLSPDGRLVAVQEVAGVAVWDVESMTLVSRTEPQQSTSSWMAFSPSGEHLLVPGDERSSRPMVVSRKVGANLKLLSPEEWKAAPPGAALRHGPSVFRTIDGAVVPLDGVAGFRSRGACISDDLVAVAAGGQGVRSVDLRTGEAAGPPIEVPGPARGVDVCGDLVAVLAAGWYVVNWRTGECLGGAPEPLPSPNGVPSAFRVGLMAGGSHVVVTYTDGDVRVHRLPVDGAVLPDSMHLVVQEQLRRDRAAPA